MKTTQTVNLCISLAADLRELARKAAFDDNRSLSNLISRLLRQYLQQEGYLTATRISSRHNRIRADDEHQAMLFTN